MKTIQSVILMLCMVCLTAGLCRMLVPEGKNKQVIGMITGLFVLACCVTPFLGQNNWFSQSFSQWETTQPTIQDQSYAPLLEQSAKEEVVATVSQLAQQQGVDVLSVYVETEYRNHQVWITRIEVYVKEQTVDTAKLQEAIQKTVDCVVEFSVPS